MGKWRESVVHIFKVNHDTSSPANTRSNPPESESQCRKPPTRHLYLTRWSELEPKFSVHNYSLSKIPFFCIHVDRPPVNPTNNLLLRTLPFFSISDSLTHNINLFSKLLVPISKCHNIVMFIYLYQNSKLKHSIFFCVKRKKSFLLFRRTYHRLRK